MVTACYGGHWVRKFVSTWESWEKKNVYGDIPPTAKTDRTTMPDDLREDFDERAAIMEYDGGLSRQEAERLSVQPLPLPRRSGCIHLVLAHGDGRCVRCNDHPRAI
jgi:hypothetical protein